MTSAGKKNNLGRCNEPLHLTHASTAERCCAHYCTHYAHYCAHYCAAGFICLTDFICFRASRHKLKLTRVSYTDSASPSPLLFTLGKRMDLSAVCGSGHVHEGVDLGTCVKK